MNFSADSVSNSENKDKIIGILASIIIHAVLIGIFILIVHNYDKNSQKTKVERRTLNLSKFKSQTDETAQPKQTARPTQKQIQKPTRQAKVQKPTKEMPKAKEPIKQTIYKERNATKNTSQPTSKQGGSPLLSELNNQMKAAKKEAGGPIKKLYGEDFDRLGKEEQKFIKDNLASIGRITEKYMKYPDVAVQFRQEGTSLVEFYLHPNGDMTDMRLLTSSGYKSIDKSAMESIWIAYKDYPRPSTKTLIRMYMQYSIY